MQENKRRVVKINGYLIITLLIVNPPLISSYFLSLFKVPCYLSKPWIQSSITNPGPTNKLFGRPKLQGLFFTRINKIISSSISDGVCLFEPWKLRYRLCLIGSSRRSSIGSSARRCLRWILDPASSQRAETNTGILWPEPVERHEPL